MDPTACLQGILSLARPMAAGEVMVDFVRQGTALAEAVLDLHAWLRRGGCLPEAWARKGVGDASQDASGDGG